MIRLAILVATFIAAQLVFLNRAQADDEMELTLCSKWVSETPAVTTFTCTKNGKTYATGLSFCTKEKSQSTIEEMIADIKVQRIFCKPEWSNNAFECSKDEDPETVACGAEFQASLSASY